jgi:hypothetical protein
VHVEVVAHDVPGTGFVDVQSVFEQQLHVQVPFEHEQLVSPYVQLSATVHPEPLAGSAGGQAPPDVDDDDMPEPLLATDLAPPAPPPDDVEPEGVAPPQWRLASSADAATVTRWSSILRPRTGAILPQRQAPRHPRRLAAPIVA